MIRKTAIARSIALAFGMAAVGLWTVPTAFAQSNTTGNLFGQVQSGAGAVTILIESAATGVRRTLVPDSTGRFAASSLAVGSYKATLLRDGKPVGTPVDFEVRIGQGTEVVFDGAASQTIQVTGRLARIDVSSTNSGATFTSKQLESIPVQPNLNGIIQLAPNTTRTDSRYAGGASFGGGAASENSYYINGYPVTNPLTQLGSSELPFGAISQAQIQTGGFGVEFGRSIGGVVNIISKSGSNTWEAGGAVAFTPNALRGKRKQIFWPNTGANPTTDGKLFLARSEDQISEYSVSANVGGPLVQDKVFGFFAVERIQRNSGRVIGNGGSATLIAASKLNGWSDRKDITNRYLGKFDWNITSDHIVELTLLGDRYSREESLFGFDYGTLQRNNVFNSKQTYTNDSANNLGVGASTQILKYTGYVTNDLTIQVLGGKSRTPHPVSLAGYDPSKPQVGVEGNGAYPGFTYPNLQALAGNINDPRYKEETKALRFDVEYRLGKHSLRAGIDKVKLSSLNAGVGTAGGRTFTYAATADGTFKDNGMTAAISTFPSVLRNGANYYYGTETLFNNISNAYSNQAAQYIEDKFQVTKNLLLTFGIRNEQYENLTSDGQSFLKVKDQITPRFSFAWDAQGDGSTKVFGTAGRYAIQLPTSIALRGANASLFTNQIFSYTGVAADGSPIGRTNLGPAFSTNNEYGQPKDLRSVSALDMKPNLQDELSLGIERALTPEFVGGARVTYRRLVASLDDYCDPRQLIKWANDRGITDKNGAVFGFDPVDGHTNLPFSCATFNPGRDNTFMIDYKQNGEYSKVLLTKSQLGFPDAKRTYMALDFFLEHPLKNGWYGKITYTYSKSKGNTEGQTNSDLGQADIAATVSWDHPELMAGAYGYLPNDRRHQIKALGFYQLTPQIQIGTSVRLESGRPRSCLGLPATSDDEFDSYINYGSVYHYCGGKLSPRGSVGTLPWSKTVDLNLVFRPESVKGLSLRIDAFNAFNSVVAESVLERYENNNGTKRNSYERVLSYTPERTLKFTAAYETKF